MTLIYVNDTLVDLPPGTVVSYTYQNTIIPDFKTRRVSHTNRFKAPFTEVNNILFDFANNIKIKQPYTVKSVKIVQNGYELVSNGNAVVWRTDSFYEITIYDGIINFIDSLGDETIDDLYEIDTTLHTWNAATIDSKRAATTGIAAPVLSYGHFPTIQELKNNSFSDSSIWENLERSSFDESWAVGSGIAEVQMQSFTNTTVDLERPGTSKLLRQPFKIFKGQEYSISITYYYAGDDPILYVILTGSEGELIIQFPTPSLTATLETETFTADKNYDFIGIYGFLQPPATTGSDSTILTVELIDITIQLKIGDVYLPSVYYKTILETMVDNAGYSLDATFNPDPYLYLVLPFCKKELSYTGFFNKCREFIAKLSAPVTISADGNIEFDTITKKDLFGLYDPTDGTYDTASPYQPVVSVDTRDFYVKFFVSLKVRLDSGTANISISDGAGALLLTGVDLTSVGTYEVNLQLNKFGTDDTGYNFNGGGSISVYVDITVGGSVTILSGEFYNIVDGINQETTPRFYTCEVLPTMKKTQLFKDFCGRFGLIPKEKHNVITVRTFDQVIADKLNALDWTNKHDPSFVDEVIYQSSLSQNNYFVYSSSDKFFKGEFSRGNIQSDNINLPNEGTIYESDFNGSIDVSIGYDSGSIYCGLVPLWNSAPEAYPVVKNDPFDNEVGFRLMVVHDRTDESAVFYNGTSRTDYKIANFLLPTSGFLSWDAFINFSYKGIKEAIKQNKSLIRHYNLSEFDMQQVDPHKLVYDNGSYFMINKIYNFVPGRITKVELFKVA